MKKQKLKLSMMILALVGLMLTSCQNEDVIADIDATQQIDLESTKTLAEIEQVTGESSAIIEETYLNEEFSVQSKSSSIERYLPDCVIVTVVLVQNIKTVTINFGDGCELRNGNFVSGKIILEYEKDREAATKTISYTYEDFYFNDKNITGGGSIFRERSNKNGNHQSTKTFDISLTWQDGSVASKKGEKIREWIEGSDTITWGDNIFLITGNGKFIKKNGVVISTEIIEPLRRELVCKFLVSGIVSLTKNNNTTTLNYGDGSCDDLAQISINGGEVKEIHLRGKK